MVKQWITGICLLALLLPMTAWAQSGSVSLTSVAEVEIKVKNDKGIEEIKRVPAASTNVAPGDAVIFTNYYSNKGDKPADKVVVTNPVPNNMFYVEGSATGKNARIEFSVDKGKSFGLPETLIVTSSDGKERPARNIDYTHIRWTLTSSILPGEKGEVAFRAKVQ